jgi:uncharacterized protein
MADPETTYLLLYDYVGEMLERRTPHREAHLAAVQAERDAGHIVMAGAFGDPPSGAAIVWRGVDRNAIEAFVSDDPYNKAGLLTGWRVEPWAVH